MCNTNNLELAVIDSVNSKSERKIKYVDLFNDLSVKFNRDKRTGLVLFEIFNSESYVKPHIDFEVFMLRFDNIKAENYKDQVLTVLCNLFATKPEEWAISDDSRFCDKKIKDPITKRTKSRQIYKISYHFILWTKKVKFETFGQFMKEKSQFFKDNGLLDIGYDNNGGIDLQIYRNGINKFRLPMTKKSYEDSQSLLTPRNYDNMESFHKHLVQIIDDCTELEIKVSETAKQKKLPTIEEKVADMVRTSNESNEIEISDILKTYTIISSKSCESGSFSNCVFYDIKEQECGENHKSNHNYLIHNKTKKTLKIKCHSKRCENFEKILVANRPLTNNFSIAFMNNLPIEDGKTDNYLEAKAYFDNFFIKIADLDCTYRISQTYNDKYKYYEKKLNSISMGTYKKILYYKSIPENKNEDDLDEIDVDISELIEQKSWNFIKRYEMDPLSTKYLGIEFKPYGVNSINTASLTDHYNLFNGFNYVKILPYSQQKELGENDLSDLKFLLNHIKMYVCGMAKSLEKNNQEDINMSNHLYDYLMNLLANIIQDPITLPEIITVFYSKTHGTGKSGFLKFLANVIGHDLSFFGSYNQITEKHTNAHVGKLINIIEESNQYESKKYHSVMKNLSQQEIALHNEKNKPQYDIKTYVRYFITTNHQDGVFFDDEDRRHVVYTFEKHPDESYVLKLLNVLQSPRVVHLFGKYLEKIKITYNRHNWIKNRPLTKDYYSMIAENPITQFLKDLLKLQGINIEPLSQFDYFITNKVERGEYDNDHISIKKESLYVLYKTFYDENNCLYKKYKNKLNFIKFLKQTYPNEIQIHKFNDYDYKGDYYTINLKKLWLELLPDELYVNNHDPDQIIDNKQPKLSFKEKDKRPEYLSTIDNENEIFANIIG